MDLKNELMKIEGSMNIGNIEEIVKEYIKERNCLNCRFKSKDLNYCTLHKKALDEMFHIALPLDELGCLQFTKKGDKGWLPEY